MSKLLKTLSVGVVAIAVVLSTSQADAASYQFTGNLTVGSRGEAVRQLQMLLNTDPTTQVAMGTSAGAPGYETTYFGNATRLALGKFQAKYGISPAAGYFGPLTRQFVNSWTPGTNPGTGTPGCNPGFLIQGSYYSSINGAPCSGQPPVNNGAVSVSLAADNTPTGSIVLGQASAELMKLSFAGTGTITNVSFQQNGLSAYNNTLNNVYLYDGATRLTDSASVSSNGVITFNNPSGLFTVNGSRKITVRADISSSASQGTVGVTLTGYAVSGTAATASIAGNLMNIVNVTAASASFTAAVSNPASGATVNAGTSNYTVWSNNLNVSTRSVLLRAATFRVVGSAPSNSLSNIKFYVDGVQQGGTGMIQNINGSNYVVFDLTATPFTITTGSHTLEVRADVVAGASFSFTVSIQNAADLRLEDSQLPGVFITASGIPTYTGGNAVSINQGTNSVTVDPNFTTTTVTGGATNIPIAQYKFTGYGEDVKITSLLVTPAVSSPTPAGQLSLQNVSLYANGAQIGSTQSFNGTTALTFNLGSSLIIPSGQSVIVTVKSDIISSTSTNYTGGSISVGLTGIASNAEGLSSHQIFAIPGSSNTPSTVTSASLSIGANSITVAKNTALTDQTVSPNSPNTKIGSFVIQAGSSEGLQVTNLSVGLVSTAGSAGLTNIQNLRLVASGLTVNPVNPTATNNFSANLTIAKNTSLVVDVFADVGATVGYASTTLTVTGRGTTSNVSTTTSAIWGQTITIATGGVTGAPTIVGSATLPAQYVIGPSSPTIATYNIVSTSTSATVQELRFNATSGTVTSLTISGGGQTQTTPVVAGVANFTGLSIPVPVGFGGVNVTITPSFATVGGVNGIASNSTSTITLVGIQSRSGNTTTYLGTTNSGGSGSAAVTGEQGHHLVASKPTIAINAGVATGLTTGQIELAQVTVTADANGNIKVNQIPLTITTAGNVAFTSTGNANFVVKDSSNNTITTATTSFPTIGTNSSGSALIAFTGGYQIAAGSSQTFKIFADTITATGTTDAVSAKLGPAGAFLWTDVNGNSGSIDGTFISNYPTGTHTTNKGN